MICEDFDKFNLSPSEDEHFSSDMHKGLMQLCESFLFLFFMWLQYFKRGEGPYNSKYVVAVSKVWDIVETWWPVSFFSQDSPYDVRAKMSKQEVLLQIMI